MTTFTFNTKLDLTILLGRKARSVTELLGGIRKVPDASMYYHTHHFLQQHHYLSPEPPNDFAYWIGEVLNDVVLAERISSVDVIQFHSIAELRSAFIDIMQSYLQTDEQPRYCPAGEEFHFMELQTFVLPTPYNATSLREFMERLQRVSIGSLYYHIFDARMRLLHDDNDFSHWFRENGYTELADAVKSLDPYTYTLEGLRKRLVVLVRNYVKN